MRWKIYYDDMTFYSSEDGDWTKAPADGVLFVNIWSDDGKVETIGGWEYYFDYDGVMGGAKCIRPLLAKLGFVKFGRWTSNERLEAIRALAHKDATWQP